MDFIDSICMPVYVAFASCNETLSPLLQGCQNNRREWQSLAEEEEGKKATAGANSEQKDV